jgi:hypothetical protein
MRQLDVIRQLHQKTLEGFREGHFMGLISINDLLA